MTRNGHEEYPVHLSKSAPGPHRRVPTPRAGSWPSGFFTHAQGRAAGKTTNATRYLCAAAYLNPGYAGTVIRELVNSHRAVPPSVGMDLGPVVRHCLRARRLQLVRDLLLSVLLLLGLIISPTLMVFAIIAGVIIGYLPSANWARKSRGTKVLTAVGIGLLLLIVLAAVVFIAVVSSVLSVLQGVGSSGTPGLGEFGQPQPSAGIRPASVAEAFIFVAIFVTQVIYLYVRSRTLSEELGPDSRPQRPGRSSSLVEPRIAAIEAAQHGNLVLYSGSDPFIGTGTRTRAWSIAIELQRAAESGRPSRPPARSGDYVPIDPVELHQVIRNRLLRLQDEGLPPNERLNSMAVHDHIIGPGQQRWDSALIDLERSIPYSNADPEAVAAIIRHPQAGVRYYQRLSVCDEGQSVWSGRQKIMDGFDQDIATSAFVYVAVEGRMLYLEFVATVLPPVHPEWRVVDLLPKLSPASFWGKVLLDAVISVLRDLAFAPFRMGRSLISIFQESRIYQAEADASKEYLYGDIGAQVSVRELGAERQLATYIQRLDAAKYTKLTERLITDTVLDFLRAKGVDTSAYANSASSVISSNVVIEGGTFSGNISLGTIGPVTQQASAQSAT
ncbi:MAG TPA: hypothetical protein VMH35_11270 [Streptosporangiaceae bacterium]|nr:hypothetical protein [Streptosporangiaceae bacterium]